MRLIPKREMLQIVGVKSFTTVWQWMREGTFPLGLAIGAQTMWRSDEIDEWLAAQQRREVKALSDKERKRPAKPQLILDAGKALNGDE